MPKFRNRRSPPSAKSYRTHIDLSPYPIRREYLSDALLNFKIIGNVDQTGWDGLEFVYIFHASSWNLGISFFLLLKTENSIKSQNYTQFGASIDTLRESQFRLSDSWLKKKKQKNNKKCVKRYRFYIFYIFFKAHRNEETHVAREITGLKGMQSIWFGEEEESA